PLPVDSAGGVRVPGPRGPQRRRRRRGRPGGNRDAARGRDRVPRAGDHSGDWGGPDMTTADVEAPEPSVDLDHHSAHFREHNYEIYEDLRARCPVAHSTAWDGFWMLLDYQDVYDAAQDHELFSSAMEKAIPMMGNPDPFVPVDMDPPLLQQYRRIGLQWFSPASAKALEPMFRELTTELIDEFRSEEHTS